MPPWRISTLFELVYGLTMPTFRKTVDSRREQGAASNRPVADGQTATVVETSLMDRILQNSLFRQSAAVLAWSALAYVAYVTLSPIEQRPVVAGIRYEHVGAFAVTACLFGMAYPRKWPWVLAILTGSAIALELLQHFVPGRHGRALDVAFKLAGTFLGLSVAWLITRRPVSGVVREDSEQLAQAAKQG
jgi:hypothetical protein